MISIRFCVLYAYMPYQYCSLLPRSKRALKKNNAKSFPHSAHCFPVCTFRLKRGKESLQGNWYHEIDTLPCGAMAAMLSSLDSTT